MVYHNYEMCTFNSLSSFFHHLTHSPVLENAATLYALQNLKTIGQRRHITSHSVVLPAHFFKSRDDA